MMTASKRDTRDGQDDTGTWLRRLMIDIQNDLARQPSPRAVARMRARVLRQIGEPAKVAA